MLKGVEEMSKKMEMAIKLARKMWAVDVMSNLYGKYEAGTLTDEDCEMAIHQLLDRKYQGFGT